MKIWIFLNGVKPTLLHVASNPLSGATGQWQGLSLVAVLAKSARASAPGITDAKHLRCESEVSPDHICSIRETPAHRQPRCRAQQTFIASWWREEVKSRNYFPLPKHWGRSALLFCPQTRVMPTDSQKKISAVQLLFPPLLRNTFASFSLLPPTRYRGVRQLIISHLQTHFQSFFESKQQRSKFLLLLLKSFLQRCLLMSLLNELS